MISRMGKTNEMPNRINVRSKRSIEDKAQFSRAIRINNLILQSGTTAIDINGNILGENAGDQVKAIMSIAEKSVAAADGLISNIFRARLYVKEKTNIPIAEKTFRNFFGTQCPVTTTFEICGLTRPQQLVEIELEGLSDPVSTKQWKKNPTSDNHSNALKIGSKIFIPGYLAKGDTLSEKLGDVRDHLRKNLNQFGAKSPDIISIRFYCSETKTLWEKSRLVAELCDLEAPVVSFVGVPTPDTMIVEAEAIIDKEIQRNNTPHPILDSFSESVCIDEDIYLSNVYPVDTFGKIIDPGNWSSQRNVCTEHLQSVLSRVNATLEDVIVRRYLTVATVDKTNYEEGPAWFESTKPAALGCRINHHAINKACISLDAHAIRGAGNDIVQRTISE